MLDLAVVFKLIIVHWIADFWLQTDKMAMNKSSSNKWLLTHVAVYTIPFLYFGWLFAFINGATHFVVDYFTSRINKRLWDDKKVHYFFVGVGFDQAIHMLILMYTASILL